MERIQKVMRGRGCLKNIPVMLEKMNIRHPVIVGMDPLPGTLFQKVPVLLSCPVFSDFHANPDLKDVQAAICLFREHRCDGLLSIGGGSSIDTAKAIKAMLFTDGKADDVLYNRYPAEMPLPHLAIPGTAGTGSEATQTAVVYDEDIKYSLNHPDLKPDGVMLDSSLLDTLPEYHKKSCALDALAQGIESYWARASTDDSRPHAYLAILGVLDNLRGYLAGDPHAADEMMDASYQSGKAIQMTRTTAAHAMSYQLTKKMGLAHGHACMVTLPALWEHMMEKEEMKPVLAELSSIMRLGDPMIVPKLLRGIMISLDMDIPLMPNEETLEELATSVNPERLGNHPVSLSKDELKAIYRKSFTPACAADMQACLDLWRYYGL